MAHAGAHVGRYSQGSVLEGMQKLCERHKQASPGLSRTHLTVQAAMLASITKQGASTPPAISSRAWPPLSWLGSRQAGEKPHQSPAHVRALKMEVAATMLRG